MKEELLSLSNRIAQESLKLGFDEVAVKLVSVMSSMVKIANSEPSVVQSWRNISVAVYLTKAKRVLVFSTQATNIDELFKTLKNLLETSSKLSPSPLYAPLPEPQDVKPLLKTTDRSIVQNMDDPSQLAELLIERAHRNEIDYIAGMLSLSYNEKALVTSKGVSLYEDSTFLESYIRAFSGEGSGQWAIGSRNLSKEKLEEMAIIASDLANKARHPEDAVPGEYDVIFSPMVAGNIFNVIARMSSAFSVYMGSSIFLKKKVGEKVASQNLTLYDDARNPELPGSTAFDDEGIPTMSKPIIERGVLKTLLHNSKTATLMKTKSTGNAGWVFPFPWTLRVEKGDSSLEEMISEVKNGILVTNNWYTRLQNHVEGTFSTITRDALFYIKDGEIERPWKKLRIVDSLPRLLQNIYLIGNKLYDIKWWEVEIPTRMPYILIKNVNTSKHTM